ncbi:leucine-rich melanocyte differentiation-associated protein isoform X2 [Petromyzon marinus]|uniref:Leucine-rich melanocyte differentiation-associated protein isoform X2 n=1 Tax=Petromyzon marinus TaxID=7757 RepID=A0AAJ7UH88_PETMA|nr:leucine-rich melanocyte differentiation-associated protein isoform X2 [Petromyzon marinus]
MEPCVEELDGGMAVVKTERGHEVCYLHQACTMIPSFLAESSLHGLDSFPALEELLLDSNELTEHVEIPVLPSLHTLTMNKNRVRELRPLLETLAVSTPALRYLSLLGNAACPNELSGMEWGDADYRIYRCAVVKALPGLRFLDALPVTKAERREAERLGPRIDKEEEAAVVVQTERQRRTERQRGPYSPLPASQRQPSDHKGVMAHCRYIYQGRQSEGNRFIYDGDL